MILSTDVSRGAVRSEWIFVVQTFYIQTFYWCECGVSRDSIIDDGDHNMFYSMDRMEDGCIIAPDSHYHSRYYEFYEA